MSKTVIALIILAALLGGLSYVVLSPTPATAALLYIHEGEVQVATQGEWVPAQDEMELRQGQKVRTLEGKATVVLYEGEIVTLTPNSEIELEGVSKKSIQLKQTAGETWNKVTKLSGIQEYGVETPSTVATVRGTEFIYSDESLHVHNGTVEYSEVKNPSNKIMVGPHESATKDMQKGPLEDPAQFAPFKETYIDTLKKLRWRALTKQGMLLKLAAAQGYGLEEIKQGLEEVDSGVKDEDALYEQVPTVFQSKLKRVYLLTKEIKRQ